MIVGVYDGECGLLYEKFKKVNKVFDGKHDIELLFVVERFEFGGEGVGVVDGVHEQVGKELVCLDEGG